MRQPERRAWHHSRPATIIVAALSPLALLLSATVLGADSAVAAPSPGYTASFIPTGTGSSPVAVAVDPITDTVYVGESSPTVRRLAIIDGSSRALEATLNLAGVPRAIAVNSATHTAYVTESNEIAVIDGATKTLKATIPLGTFVQAQDVAVDTTTNMIYVANEDGAGGVVVIDGSSNTITKTIGTGGPAVSVAVDETTDVIWVVGANVVTAISAVTGSIVHTVSVGSAWNLAVNSVTETVYVATSLATTPISVIDGATGTIKATVPVTDAALGDLAVDPSADIIYARGFSHSSLLTVVIDGATNTIADLLNTGGDTSPAGVAVDTATGTAYETAASDDGEWAITPSASNGISPLLSGPASATANVGEPFDVFFSSTGLPTPDITETGPLPAGVTLNPGGTLSGTPAPGTVGIYPITVHASNGIAPDYSLPFTLTITPPPPPAVAVAAVSTSGVPYAQAPQLGSGWHSLGGTVIAPPAVAAAPNPGGPNPVAPWFIAPGTNNVLYIRGLTGSWQRLGPQDPACLGSPAAVITGSTLTVACEGLNHALYYGSAEVPASGLPVFTTAWKGLGGVLTAGPALAPVGGVLTFFVLGSDGNIYTRTASTGYAKQTWSCLGQPAAALQAATGVTFFACQGNNHGLYVGTVTSAGIGAAGRQSGTLAAGPGIAAASSALVLLLEGTNQVVYEGTPGTAYTSLPGILVSGVEAAALN